MLQLTFLFLGQLWQLFEVSQFLEFLRYIILRIQRLGANSVDLEEMAHDEPPHQDLRCLKFQLFSSLVPTNLIECQNHGLSAAQELVI